MSRISFDSFMDTDSMELRRSKLNILLSCVTELETMITQFQDIFTFIKNTYNSKPYFFNSIDSMSDCKFLQNNFICICLIEESDKTYLRYYRVTNSESQESDGDNIVDIIHDSNLKAVKIPDLFGIEEIIHRIENLESPSTTENTSTTEDTSGGGNNG